MDVILIALICGALGGLVREIIGNKGLLCFPKFTEKGLTLGCLTSIILGAVSGLGFLQTVNLNSPYWYATIAAGGLAGSDLIANITNLIEERRKTDG